MFKAQESDSQCRKIFTSVVFFVGMCSYVAGAAPPAASTFTPMLLSQPYMTTGVNLPPQQQQQTQPPPQSMYNTANVPQQQMM